MPGYRRANKDRGCAGLIAILIVVAIIAYLMVRQYEQYGLVPSGTGTTTSAENTEPESLTPIEQAKNAKALLESQDRANLNQ